MGYWMIVHGAVSIKAIELTAPVAIIAVLAAAAPVAAAFAFAHISQCKKH
jgi:p-aminobenzoyl-glutamate transporter AbgT